MGITSALYSGVSGLNTDAQAMSVIGNNLANTATTGFKGSRTVFSDLLSSEIFGSGGISQVGRGVNVSKVDNVFSQGTFQSTDSGTDVAIEGGSFFLLKKAGDETTYYSRAGAFRFDEQGYLVNPEGLRVQGYQYSATTQTLTPGNPSDIQVANTGLIPANVTTQITLNTNLDASSTVIPSGGVGVVPFLYSDPTSFNYSSSVQTYDTLGNSHLVTFYFRKEDILHGGAANTWDWYWTAPDNSTPVVTLGQATSGAAPAGSITFQPDGTLAAPAAGVIGAGALPWNNGSLDTGVAVTFDTTQFSSSSAVISQSQDGYGAGNLTGINIDTTGTVNAAYSNGVTLKVAGLALGKFAAPTGLEQVGNNLFLATTESGDPRVGLPGTELGKIFTNSLEQSNVDTGAQFVEMITVQRAYQANSKIITTVDQMLNDVINMKQ